MCKQSDEQIALKAARLAAVYGHDWNKLPDDERAKYVRCVHAIHAAAEAGDG